MHTSPRGPIFGASEEVAPTSPPTALRYTVSKRNVNNQLAIRFRVVLSTILPMLIAFGSNFGGISTGSYPPHTLHWVNTSSTCT